MEGKRLVIGVAVSMAIFFGWISLTGFLDRKYGKPEGPKQTATNPAPAPAPASTQPGSTTVPTMTATTTPASSGVLEVMAQGDSKVMADLGSAALKDPRYAMLLRTTAAGAGVESVVLNSFLKSVDDPSKEPYVFQQAEASVLALYGHPLATRMVSVDGTQIDLSKAAWTLEHKDGNAVTYALTIGRGRTPVLKILKTYRIYTQEHAGKGYEILLDYAFENHSGRQLAVSMSYNGPAMPPRELDSGPDQRVIAGYPTSVNVITAENHYIESLSGSTQTMELAVYENKPMYWAGGSSVYFQGLLMPPLQPDGATTSVRSFKAYGLNPENRDHQPVALTVETADLTIAANHRLTYPIHVYFGPKWRNVLTQPFYASMPRHYDQTLVVRAGPCAFCTFDWLINFLVVLLGWFHWVWGGFKGHGDWGLAIICLVLIVRLALHPITKRSQVSMMKMGKMAPEMKRLQEKYKDNKEELQKAMWEFQKQQGITPVLGCLPMFLQMPIWIALWSALNTTFELRHSNFLWGLTWIDDLAKPDRLIPFPAGWGFKIWFIGTVVDAVNVLPLLLAVVFYLQQKYTPKPPTMTKEQEQQQKIMQGMMVFLFPLFLYGQPSGLNLYILTSTAIGIWESKRIRAHIKEKEEAEKAGLVIVDAEPAKESGKGKKKDRGGKGGPAAKQTVQGGWLARKLAELQQKAEEARRQSDRRKG